MRIRRSTKTTAVLLALLCAVSLEAAAQGKKYGLFVGINAYSGGVNPLNGCVNDARNMQRTLSDKYGFDLSNTTLLTDGQATRDGIINAMKEYQAKAQAGDLFVFTYSGHGTLFPDDRSEELDEEEPLEMPGMYPLAKYDSAICPIDLRSNTSGKPWNNLILDDELFNFFSGFTKKGAMVVFISDSCHSGTLARSMGSNSFVSKLQPRARFLALPTVRSLGSIPRPATSRRITRGRSDMGGLLIVLSGSRDNEFSLDYPDPSGSVNGLFTKTLLQTLNDLRDEGRNATYLAVRDIVSPRVKDLAAAKDNSQNPQIDNRFFSGGLDIPLFQFPGTVNAIPQSGEAPSASVQGLLRIVIKVTDGAGTPVEGAAVGVFNETAGRSLKAGQVGKISPRDIRATAHTNNKGIYDSKIDGIMLPEATYFIKVVLKGYKAYIGDIKVKENAPGYSVQIVKLIKE